MSTKVYRDRRRGLIVPIFLIGLGILLLLSNLGLLSWTVWEAVFRLWPIFLIAVGLEVLIGRRSVFGSLLIFMVVALIAAFSLFALNVWPTASSWSISGGEITTKDISRPLYDGTTRAELEIGVNVGTLKVNELQDSPNLIEGTVDLSNGENLSVNYYNLGDTAYYDLQSQEVKIFPFSNNTNNNDRIWQLGLNGGIPLRLNVNTGVGTSDIDLAKLNVTDLSVKSGIGKTSVTLPAQGKVQADFSGGIGETNVVIPQGVAARIKVNSGIGNTDVAGNYQYRNGAYVSPDYDSALNRVDVDIKGGIGKITVIGSN